MLISCCLAVHCSIVIYSESLVTVSLFGTAFFSVALALNFDTWRVYLVINKNLPGYFIWEKVFAFFHHLEH